MNYPQEKIKPYDQKTGKGVQVEVMFDRIAPAYDLLNHLLSLGIDRYWRKKAIAVLKHDAPHRIMDMATGTGDLALLIARKLPDAQVTGVDLSEEMMQIAREKSQSAGISPEKISFRREDCMNLTFQDHVFDAVTVAFGVRNFEDLDQGLSEIYRVLCEQGMLLILELAAPNRFPMKQLFSAYSRCVLPLLGRLFSKDRQAYSYLSESVSVFPQGEIMADILRKAGFAEVAFKRMTLGICTLYIARK